MNYLPSQRFFIVVLMLGVMLAGGVWYLGKNDVPEEKYVLTTAASLRAKAGGEKNTDGDKDGLKDWEEALWKTNPKSADTDGDGTWDGEEVRAGRDPLVRGPNDTRTGKSPQIGDANNNQVGVGNLTEAFNKALAGTVGVKIASGQSLSEVDLQKIKKYLPSRDAILGTVPEIRVSDLVISDRNDPASVKQYFASIYAIYEKTLIPIKEDDIQILARWFLEEKSEELQKIDTILFQFDESIRHIKALAVPKGYEEFAAKEINYLSNGRRAISILRHVDEDPLSAMAVLEFRLDLEEEFITFHRDYGKILFTKITPGENDAWRTFFE